MAWTVRSLPELSQRVRGAFRQYVPGTDASLKQNVLYAWRKVWALLAQEYELRLAILYRQLFVATADGAHLRVHGADYRLYPKAASAATGTITTVGAISTLYPAGIRYLSGNQAYVTTAAATSTVAGAVTFPVISEGTGAAVNREGGTILLLASPGSYPTLTGQAEVAGGGIGGGADPEDVESFRERIRDRKSYTPQGGSEADYESFARAVPGVKKAWARRFVDGPGTVGVYFLFEGRPNFIPTGGDVAAVQAAIDARRLIRLDAYAIAPIPAPVNIKIASLDRNDAAVQAAISANLVAMLYARTRPGLPGDPFVLPHAWLSETISQTVGEERHTMILPVGNLVFEAPLYPVLGTITYA